MRCGQALRDSFNIVAFHCFWFNRLLSSVYGSYKLFSPTSSFSVIGILVSSWISSSIFMSPSLSVFIFRYCSSRSSNSSISNHPYFFKLDINFHNCFKIFFSFRRCFVNHPRWLHQKFSSRGLSFSLAIGRNDNPCRPGLACCHMITVDML